MSDFPKAREEGLIVEPLDDELLVYDTQSYRSHALNPTAAPVWRHCDGRISLPELARSSGTSRPACSRDACLGDAAASRWRR